MDMVTVFTTFTPGEADLVASRLKVAGFTASIVNEYSAITLAPAAIAAGGIQVQVPEDQAQEVREFIESTIKSETPAAENPSS